MNFLISSVELTSGQTLQLVRGDITEETTDAIVNAANAYLKHGSGVAGAILQQGGRIIQDESDDWIREHGPVSHSNPAWTSGGNLPCRVVIHAVGPVWDESNEPSLADNNYEAAINGCLRLADRLGLTSIAFPAISTGVFGFPKERAANLMFATFTNYFRMVSGINLVRVVVFDTAAESVFEKIWNDHFESKSQD
jgi:O-acetyl-ADP-ribose deacetylase (regulator of RNase III)